MTTQAFEAPTPRTAQRMTRNLRGRGYQVLRVGRVVRVVAMAGDTGARLVAQRYAAVEVEK